MAMAATVKNSAKRALNTQGLVLVRSLHSSSLPTPSAAASAAAASPSSSAISNPLNVSSAPAGGLGLSNLARPGGRQSVSGIVATVFGCSGFLGRHVVSNLGRIGSQVITPYRGDGMNVRPLKLAGDLGQIVPIPYDLTDMETVRRCIARSNVVINLIGSRTESSNYSYDDLHVKIPYRLAQVSKSLGVERFIHVSTVGADPASESKLFKSKGLGEEVVREFYPDATIIRPTVMFGPMDKFLSYYAYVGHKLAAVPITRNGERRLQPVYVGDVARAILNSIADPSSRGQTYELGGSDIYTEQQIIDLVAKHTKSDVSGFSMPDIIARLYGAAVGGRRGLTTRDYTGAAGVLYNTGVGAINKLSFPSVFNPDMVDQAHTDLTLRGLPGLKDLGVDVPMPLDAQLDRILFPHRLESPDRFPDAEKMKRDAKNNASY